MECSSTHCNVRLVCFSIDTLINSSSAQSMVSARSAHHHDFITSLLGTWFLSSLYPIPSRRERLSSIELLWVVPLLVLWIEEAHILNKETCPAQCNCQLVRSVVGLLAQVSKVTVTFRDIIHQYRLQPQCKFHVFRNVFIDLPPRQRNGVCTLQPYEMKYILQLEG
jgi:hypothetical protein